MFRLLRSYCGFLRINISRDNFERLIIINKYMKKLICAVIVATLMPINCFAMKVGVISDIHAGSKSKRKAGSSVIYPKKAVSYFERALKEMKFEGVELIVALGDNTQQDSKKNLKKLKKFENKYGIKVLWVFGNHDDNKNFSKYMGSKTYVHNQDGYRFIVLNTDTCINGCLNQTQIDFLNSNKNDHTIILQHHPPLHEDTCNFRESFSAEKDMTVWSGHWHSDMICGKVRVFPALTEHKKLNYLIIDL